MWPLNDACDFFLKAVANLAYDTEPVADVSGEDVKVQALDELPAAWEKAVTAEEWPKVLNVLSRGGRFWPVEGEHGRRRTFRLHEGPPSPSSTASARPRMRTRSPASSCRAPLAPPPSCWPTSRRWPRSTRRANGRSAPRNYKPRFRSITVLGEQSHHAGPLRPQLPGAQPGRRGRSGIEDGDAIRITNPTGDVMEGEAMVRAGIARGTFGVGLRLRSHRLWSPRRHDRGRGKPTGRPGIGAGVHLQTILDPTVEDPYPYVDPEAASPARSGGVYKIEKYKGGVSNE